MKTILFIALLIMTGCSSNIFQSGSYKVVSIKKFNGKSVVQLEGYKREFILPTDSLKKDDYIFISAIQGINSREGSIRKE